MKMSRKIIITKGLPASGKTTWSLKQMADNPGQFKRVNKDDLRNMIDGGKYSKGNEQFILELRDQMILRALDNGKSVIVDDTNLHPKHEHNIREIAKNYPAEIQVRIADFTDVPLDVCLSRDACRANPVGSKVITDMYNQFLKPEPVQPIYDPNLRDCIICDIDGTVALMNGRSPYDTAKCDMDLPNTVIIDVLNILIRATYIKLIFCSGRGDNYRKLTEDWLIKNVPTYIPGITPVFMRQVDDNREDSIIKQEIYDNEIEGKYNVKLVLDDRNRVVDMWRRNGLTCLQVAEGNF